MGICRSSKYIKAIIIAYIRWLKCARQTIFMLHLFLFHCSHGPLYHAPNSSWIQNIIVIVITATLIMIILINCIAYTVLYACDLVFIDYVIAYSKTLFFFSSLSLQPMSTSVIQNHPRMVITWWNFREGEKNSSALLCRRCNPKSLSLCWRTLSWISWGSGWSIRRWIHLADIIILWRTPHPTWTFPMEILCIMFGTAHVSEYHDRADTVRANNSIANLWKLSQNKNAIPLNVSLSDVTSLYMKY